MSKVFASMACAGIEHMRSRFLPYATTPGRLALQLLSDILITLWTTVWVLVGLAVHAAISSFAKFGRQVNTSSTDIAHNFDSAGQRAEDIPLLGTALSKPFVAAGDAAHDIAAAGISTPPRRGWPSSWRWRSQHPRRWRSWFPGSSAG
jgi:hypothetical protein